MPGVARKSQCKNSCWSNCSAVGLNIGDLLKHLFKKSNNSFEHLGISGKLLAHFTYLITCSVVLHLFDQGGLPVSISMIVHPKDQISAEKLCFS